MLDLKFVREKPEVVRKAMEFKGEEADLDLLLSLDIKRRELLQEAEALKRLRNRVSRQIGHLRGTVDDADLSSKRKEMQQVSSRIKGLDEKIRRVENRLNQELLRLPNLPHPEVPPGLDEEGNREVRRWGTPIEPSSPLKPHWEIGEELGILDFRRAGKISGRPVCPLLW